MNFFGLSLLAGGFVLSACGGGEPPQPLPPEGTETGRLAPALFGTSPDGSNFELERGGGPQLLVFYRSYDCGLCRVRLERLQQNLPAYRTAGVAVTALTFDLPVDAGRAASELGLGFPVVSIDSAALASYDVLGGRGEVLPASYLLDERGVIIFRQVGRNAADRASDVAILAALRQTRGEEAGPANY
ncbi:MAG: peroxiredoxin family protein [Longimicrobiaceae bacterium]